MPIIVDPRKIQKTTSTAIWRLDKYNGQTSTNITSAYRVKLYHRRATDGCENCSSNS